MTTAVAELPATEQPSTAIAVAQPITQSVVLLSVTDVTINKMIADYSRLSVTGVDDKEGLAKVHAARMECVKARGSIKKSHDDMKADTLAYGRKLDAEQRRLLALIAPLEEHLTEQEGIVEQEKARIAKEKEDAMVAVRFGRLTAVGGSLPDVAVRAMGPEQFEHELAQVAEQVRLKKEADARAAEEAERQRVAAAELAEKNRLESERLERERVELDRQKAEQTEAARIEQVRLDQQRQEQEAALAQQREADALKAKEEQDRLEGIRQEQERAAQVERDRLAEIERGQQVERDRLVAEQKRLDDERLERDRLVRVEQERAEIAERDRIESERQVARNIEAERLRAEKAELLRPDVEKIVGMAAILRAIKLPTVGSPEANEFLGDLQSDIEQIATACEGFAQRVA